jgi:glucuronoxylan 4-O-methyltransferase
MSDKFELMLNEKMEKSNHGQMTADEYRYIASFLGDKNFLVFGTGHDTPLWRYTNSKGKTLFLENIVKWIKSEDTDVIKVAYTTKRAQYKELLEEYRQGKYDRLVMDLPRVVLDTQWDCIFVDSPVGTTDKKPGRMQSIYMASVLANSNTEIFVHDCDRTVEDVYTTEMFSIFIKELTKLRHVRL